jgi:hypothetical protein
MDLLHFYYCVKVCSKIGILKESQAHLNNPQKTSIWGEGYSEHRADNFEGHRDRFWNYSAKFSMLLGRSQNDKKKF